MKYLFLSFKGLMVPLAWNCTTVMTVEHCYNNSEQGSWDCTNSLFSCYNSYLVLSLIENREKSRLGTQNCPCHTHDVVLAVLFLSVFDCSDLIMTVHVLQHTSNWEKKSVRAINFFIEKLMTTLASLKSLRNASNCALIEIN